MTNRTSCFAGASGINSSVVVKWSHLCHIQICLHDQERIEGVRPRGIGVVEKVTDFVKSSLQAGATKNRGRYSAPSRATHRSSGVKCGFQTQTFWGMSQGRHNSRVERLDFFKPRGCELSLRWRSLVNSDPYEDLSEKREYTRSIVET